MNNETENKEITVIAEAMLEKKAKDVVAMDLTGIGTAITDNFVICNADSTTQVVAISDNIVEKMWTECHRDPIRSQGRENAFWIILDYGDTVVHVFKTEYREFYRLEDLWADAEKTIFTDDEQ
ncbi:MAG: ribosome silencing factor [Bacteroidales bacterium]|nr:ribosome silencing factor [Bacteroidales bacterium]